MLDLSRRDLAWEAVEHASNFERRVYHTANFCTFGASQGLIIYFGGKDGGLHTRGDIFALSKNEEEEQWKVPPKSNFIDQMGVYNHASFFVGSLLFFVGGRISKKIFNNSILIFDAEQNKWYKSENILPSVSRHVS